MKSLIELFRHLPPVPIHYHEFFFRVLVAFVAAHVIIALGDEDMLLDMLLTVSCFVALAASFIITLTLISVVHEVTCKLDRQMRLAEKKSLLYGDQSACESYDLQETGERLTRVQAVPGSRKVFIVHTTTKSVPVSVEDICYFFREGGHNFLRTFERVDYLIPQSLNEVQQKLDKRQFFRVNRQLIINYKACRDFRPAAYGKLELTLREPFHTPVKVSQLKAPKFRRWVQGGACLAIL